MQSQSPGGESHGNQRGNFATYTVSVVGFGMGMRLAGGVWGGMCDVILFRADLGC